MAYDQYKGRLNSPDSAGEAAGESELPTSRPSSRQGGGGGGSRGEGGAGAPESRRAVSRRYQSRLPGL